MDKRAELKRWYKENPPQGGVYQIKNLANGKIMVRSNANFTGGFNRDKMELNAGTSRFSRLQADWKQFGEAQFSFEILDVYKPKEEDTLEQRRKELLLLEQMWCEKLQPYGDKGYNIPA
jgi:hypothetical protein